MQQTLNLVFVYIPTFAQRICVALTLLCGLCEKVMKDGLKGIDKWSDIDVIEVGILQKCHNLGKLKRPSSSSFPPRMAAKMEQTEKYLHPEKIAFAIYDVKLINHKSRGNPRYLGGILFDCKICSTIPGKQSALPSYCSLSRGEYLFARKTKYHS